ncbi:glycosyltransferase family 9 protein [Mycobacterium sp. MYCO198283]|uniref:glycosyltransferase family 9 protein n=1 Tax=Mycobacterium sp. MYCO198283 TaxID=2883505 RepID=UPI001E56DF5B|nr:glycosyltransferase family 9 protein [Mycobacterium sp. MYCO198283]MCG5433626.1 glycosyltransferase family 9 protein [Mycobacterium sp. MYCO198283]
MRAVGPVADRWPDVRRIAVLRGDGLGDVLLAGPAIDALAAAYPDAEIVLMCAPGNDQLYRGRPSAVTEVVPLPYAHGVHDVGAGNGEGNDPRAFRDAVCRRPIDLGVQLHGGGRWSNPFLLALAPRWTVGTRTPDAAELTRWLPYRPYQHAVLRWLEVAGLAGAPPVTLDPRVEVTDADRAAARRVLPPSDRPTLVIHPGARDPRRRWPPEHFAAVAAACLRDGARAVIVGTAAERTVMRDVAAKVDGMVVGGARHRVTVLDGLDLAALVGVLDAGDVLLGNDSGVRHLAQAVGTPTVGIYWIGNAFNAAPLGRLRHRVLMSFTTQCPLCGRDCTRPETPRCEHDVPIVADIAPDEVLDEVRELLA